MKCITLYSDKNKDIFVNNTCLEFQCVLDEPIRNPSQLGLARLVVVERKRKQEQQVAKYYPETQMTNFLVVSPLRGAVPFVSGKFASMRSLYNAIKGSLGPQNLEPALKRLAKSAIADQTRLFDQMAKGAVLRFNPVIIPEPRNEVVLSTGDTLPFPIRLYTSATDLFLQIRLASPAMHVGMQALHDLQKIIALEFPDIKLVLTPPPPTRQAREARPNVTAVSSFNFQTDFFPTIFTVSCNITLESCLRTTSCGSEGTFISGGWHFNFTQVEYQTVARSEVRSIKISLNDNSNSASFWKGFDLSQISTFVVLHQRNPSISKEVRADLCLVSKAPRKGKHGRKSGFCRGLWRAV